MSAEKVIVQWLKDVLPKAAEEDLESYSKKLIADGFDSASLSLLNGQWLRSNGFKEGHVLLIEKKIDSAKENHAGEFVVGAPGRFDSVDFIFHTQLFCSHRSSIRHSIGIRCATRLFQPGTILLVIAVSLEAIPRKRPRLEDDAIEIPSTPPAPVYREEENPPPFVCGKSWFGAALSIVQTFLPSDDTTLPFRIPPLVLSRCSRGGKTRTLNEVALKLATQLAVYTLVVSFNGSLTPLSDCEEDAPLFALTRRIAFALSTCEKTGEVFESQFLRLEIEETVVAKWLEKGKWVLLVDELNSLDLKSQKRRPANQVFAKFIKSGFLNKKFWRCRCFRL